MLAMKYWQCSETTAMLGEKDEDLVQLVFAEPLPNAGGLRGAPTNYCYK